VQADGAGVGEGVLQGAEPSVLGAFTANDAEGRVLLAKLLDLSLILCERTVREGTSLCGPGDDSIESDGESDDDGHDGSSSQGSDGDDSNSGAGSSAEDELTMRRRYDAAARELPSALLAKLLPPGPARAAAAAAAAAAEAVGEEEEEGSAVWQLGVVASGAAGAAEALMAFVRRWQAGHPRLTAALAPRAPAAVSTLTMARMNL
jgi:hypothetical protein